MSQKWIRSSFFKNFEVVKFNWLFWEAHLTKNTLWSQRFLNWLNWIVMIKQWNFRQNLHRSHVRREIRKTINLSLILYWSLIFHQYRLRGIPQDFLASSSVVQNKMNRLLICRYITRIIFLTSIMDWILSSRLHGSLINLQSIGSFEIFVENSQRKLLLSRKFVVLYLVWVQWNCIFVWTRQKLWHLSW